MIDRELIDRNLVEDIVAELSDDQVKRLMDKYGEDIWFKYGNYVTLTESQPLR